MDLTDYNFQSDIEDRIFISKLTSEELEVLVEIINNSVCFPIEQLLDELNTSEKKLNPILDKLQKSGLFTIENKKIHVNKDKRKFYELLINWFEDDYNPGIEFLQGSLSRIPLHILPIWYAISKTSDDILQSIIEKHLVSPKVYNRYLEELQFETPLSRQIHQELISSPKYQIPISEILKKVSISEEELEKHLIQLEFNLVCCSSFKKRGSGWVRYVTPFNEWRQFLMFIESTQCKEIAHEESIERYHPNDFGFVEDLSLLLESLIEAGKLSTSDNNASIQESLDIDCESSFAKDYVNSLIKSAVFLKVVEIQDRFLYPTELAVEWADKSIQDRAITLYFHSIQKYRNLDPLTAKYTDRDIREVEKAIKRVLNLGWVYVEDFIKGSMAAIGESEEIKLTKKGKSWVYKLPVHTEADKEFIRQVLNEHLFQSGMVALGECDGRQYFRVTPFGKLSLGD